MGISDATFYKWRQKYGDLGPSELRKLLHPRKFRYSRWSKFKRRRCDTGAGQHRGDQRQTYDDQSR